MIMSKEEKYVYCSRTIRHVEVGGNVNIEASKLRKILALDYFSSIELGADNDAVNTLLERNLKNYAKVVDDHSGVNNYAARVMELLPNNLPEHLKTRTTSLTTDKVKKLLLPLPCTSNEADIFQGASCANSKPSINAIKNIQEAKKKFVSETPKHGPPPMPPPPPIIEPSRNIPRITKEPTRPYFSPQSQSQSSFVPKISLFKKRPQQNDTRSAAESAQNSKAPINFRTASDELKLQNLKKHGSEGGRGNAQYNYGTGKKSLGTRKGSSVNNKFQPPLLRDDEEKQSHGSSRKDSNIDDSDDERLKNIDPKMVELIRNEIMDCGAKLTWDDIAGLEFAKNTIQEVVVWPMLRPDIFTGLRRPPKGILLFGPPGTGKTLIGKCIASQSGASFFSISSSSLTSKWIGDGEKMVRALFAVARVYQPAVVFIDEIDSLLSQRSDSEHESSRRMKTEFLVQLDGCATGDDDRILIIGATNRPQELDEAARRRLVKRLYIPLPELEARAEIIRNLISKERHTLTEDDVREIAELTDGYSGADMKHVCQEASLGPIRSIPASQIRDISSSQVRPVNVADFKSALHRVKSTVSQNDLEAYVAWDKQFGCGSL